MLPVVARLVERLYGRPLVRNVVRGELVEQMILDALGPEWRDAGDYQNWDIEHRTAGCRIQVKQGAAKQSWSTTDSKPSRPRFSIAAKVGYSERRVRWDEPRARRCELYIFAWHPRFTDDADHRDIRQWEFHVVKTADLPDQGSIGLAAVKTITAPICADQLAGAVAEAMSA